MIFRGIIENVESNRSMRFYLKKEAVVRSPLNQESGKYEVNKKKGPERIFRYCNVQSVQDSLNTD